MYEESNDMDIVEYLLLAVIAVSVAALAISMWCNRDGGDKRKRS